MDDIEILRRDIFGFVAGQSQVRSTAQIDDRTDAVAADIFGKLLGLVLGRSLDDAGNDLIENLPESCR